MSDGARAARTVRIVHETNPRKYFPAVFDLADRGEIDLVGEYRYSAIKEWVRGWIIDRTPARTRTRHMVHDLTMRASVPFVHDEVIILGFAPWSFRLLWFWPLVVRNRVIYHTSWPDWRDRSVPRVYGPLTPVMKRMWLRFLHSPHVHAVAVSAAAKEQLTARARVDSTLIPLAVPQVFFDAAHDPDEEGRPLRLVFVGELSAKKGLPQLLHLVRGWQGAPIELTVIGTGPMVGATENAARADERIRYAGSISGRDEMARELARHDLLVVLSQRQRNWEELFGLVIIEAIAAGLGVITSDHVGPRSIFDGTDLGNVFDQSDVAGVSALLRRLAADPVARAGFRRAHNGLADAYRIETVAAQWLDVISGREPRVIFARRLRAGV